MTSAQATRAADKFLAYFGEIQKAHEATLGGPLELYKDTDRACLESSFETMLGSGARGAMFVVAAINGLVWGQCLRKRKPPHDRTVHADLS